MVGLFSSWGGLLAAAPSLSAPGPAPSSETNAPALTRVAQILELSPQQARAGLPVNIRGTVTYYDHGLLLFVQDETAGIFVYYMGDRLPMRPGQAVQVTGFTSQGRYSPVIDPHAIQLVEKAPALTPRVASLAEISLGGLDAQWVETAGLVRFQQLNRNRLQLQLTVPPHRVSVSVSDCRGDEELPRVGSWVRVRGVVGTTLNDRGQLESLQIFATTLADVTTLRPAPADPFAAPPRPIRDLASYYVREGASGLVRVRGVVTLYRPHRALFIQDSTGGLEVRTEQPLEGVGPGATVDIAGFLGPILETPRLEGALIRSLGTDQPPQAVRLLAEDLFHGRHDSELVELECGLLKLTESPADGLVVALQAGERILTAQLDAPHPPLALAALQPGCRLRATGVCRSQAGLEADHAVSLLLRSPADLHVLSPPVQTRGRGFEALAASVVLIGVGLAAALWIIGRQRRRTSQVLQLQAALQAEMSEGEQQLRRSMEEREQIGRDLHDEIIQSIYAVGLGLEDCRRVVRHSPEQAEPRLGAAIATLNNTIRSVRGFIAGLEPKILNGREFKTALKSLALTSGDGAAQFRIEVDAPAASRLTSTQATQLLHIAKEAMSNCLRHARASDITVSLRPVSPGVRLEIRDDGAGFDPAAVSGTGHGLRNMAARAREIGADLQMISALGQGCRILVTVPLRDVHELD
jgi:signal transduction histidine kinase